MVAVAVLVADCRRESIQLLLVEVIVGIAGSGLQEIESGKAPHPPWAALWSKPHRPHCGRMY